MNIINLKLLRMTLDVFGKAIFDYDFKVIVLNILESIINLL